MYTECHSLSLPAALPFFHLSPCSSNANSGRFWPAMRATALAQSRPEPPPKAMTPSWPPALYAATPSSTFLPTGFGFTAENRPVGKPSAALAAIASLTIGRDRKSVGWGKRVSVRVDLAGRGLNKKNKE